jgi:hypothetical protein
MQKKPNFLFLFLSGLIFLITSSFLHPFYVSITQIDHNPATQSLEISIKIFREDLEFALEKQGDEKLFLGEEKEAIGADDRIREYLSARFSLEVNDSLKKWDFLGKEVEEDVVWCYLEARKVPDVYEIRVTNSLLTETFSDQTNLVHVHISDKEKSLVLNRESPAGALSF